MLAPEVRAELRSLSRPQAAQVARHLVAAGRFVDADPELALRHAREARRMAARIGVVREAVGIAAYHAGEWAEALTELRAARRLTGDPSHLPLMADCERAMGRPERALRVVQSPEASRLSTAGRVELRMVEAGARRDLGETDAALMALRGAGLDRARPMPWSARLWYAYADTLLAAGQLDEAQDWFLAVAGVDAADQTDVEDRLVELGVLEPVDEPDDDPGSHGGHPGGDHAPEPSMPAQATPPPDQGRPAAEPAPESKLVGHADLPTAPLLFQEPAHTETPSIAPSTDNSGS
jgi:tetratricopeptide (TPR) repeat protein